jgi:magnesium/cobalt transport protein CorA
MAEFNSSIIEFDISKKTSECVSVDAISEAAEKDDSNKIFWIHCDLHDKEFFNNISKTFHLSDTVMQYINDHSSIPKVEDTEDTLTIKISAPLEVATDKNIHLEFTTLIIHLTRHYCLTISKKPIPALEEFKVNHDKSLRFAKTPCFITFIVLDNILNDYAKLLFHFETICDLLERKSHSANKSQYREVMKVKKLVIKTKRFTSAIRDILMRISGRKINVVSEQCRKSLLDTYTHSQAIVSETDSVREVLNGILDQIDNAIMHKMSETMTVLTAYATMIMPPTLIASIYGMNFVNMPELHWHYGYYFAISLMLGIALALYFVFKRRKWF